MRFPFFLTWLPDCWRGIKWLIGLTRVGAWNVYLLAMGVFLLWAVANLVGLTPSAPVPNPASLEGLRQKAELAGMSEICRAEADCREFLSDLSMAEAEEGWTHVSEALRMAKALGRTAEARQACPARDECDGRGGAS
ncbi:hypothetical protein FACS1894186_6840 [Alphaproteobacteria bacterium]|nr:hypothetical protein FACS1894186_6840 [Alphaproteobacteria bacterium]